MNYDYYYFVNFSSDQGEKFSRNIFEILAEYNFTNCVVLFTAIHGHYPI